jgi:hypothetical protein
MQGSISATKISIFLYAVGFMLFGFILRDRSFHLSIHLTSVFGIGVFLSMNAIAARKELTSNAPRLRAVERKNDGQVPSTLAFTHGHQSEMVTQTEDAAK